MQDFSRFKNILLFSIEDLNDWIEPLGGHPQAVTPNLSRLAKRGINYTQAFTTSPACAPARTAALFGQGPWRTGVYGNDQSWAMQYPPGARRSIVGQARAAGWTTVGAGKVFHLGRSGLDMEDWDAFHHLPGERFTPRSTAAKRGHLKGNADFGPVPDDVVLHDELHASWMMDNMEAGAEQQFWALGTFRPHLPFIVPQRYFDMIKTPVSQPPSFGNRAYDPEDHTDLQGLSPFARKISRRWTGRVLQKTGEYEAYLHAYLASVAFADHQLGRLLDHLEATGLSDTTLILLWSDHGWQFGEKLAFRKFTPWERSLRVPFMMAGPGIAPGQSNTPISLLDLYPTLLDLIGRPPPHVLDGQSLWTTASRGPAISVHCTDSSGAPGGDLMSVSLRNKTHRLILYHTGLGELYDHRTDPFEHRNLLRPRQLISAQELPPDALELIDHVPDMVPPKTLEDLPDDLPTRFRAWSKDGKGRGDVLA